jgi:hypothetical protein
MKMHFVCSALIALALVPAASADPILPYQQPIEQQLTADLNAGTGNTATLNKALTAYGKASKSLSSDISILRNLNDLLADEAGYESLLADAASAYLSDFQVRRNVLGEQLRPAPRSSTKTTAQKQLRRLDGSLSNAVNATSTAQRISALQSSATKLINTSNTVQRALRTRSGLSSMVAQIGAISFQSTRGFIAGGTNFSAAPGTGVGVFNDGVLAITGIGNGNIVRAIHLHVEGITSDTPATYPIGSGGNFAFYDATDRTRRDEYHFEADSSLTNSAVPGAFVTIDYISTNYILGRFAFVGTNSQPQTAKDTNTIVTVSNGEFQLNFSR